MRDNKSEKYGRRPKGPEWLELGQWLKEKREKAGLSPQQLADEIGIGRTTVVYVEEGLSYPPIEKFGEWLDAVKTSREETLAKINEVAKHVHEEKARYDEYIERLKKQAHQPKNEYEAIASEEALKGLKREQSVKKLEERFFHLEQLRTVVLSKPLPVYPVRAGKYRIADGELLTYIWAPEGVRADGALLVEGDSLSGLGIRAGDYLYYCKDIAPVNGCIVAALIEEGPGLMTGTVKRYKVENGNIKLEAVYEDGTVEEVPFDPEKDRIFAVITGHLRNLV